MDRLCKFSTSILAGNVATLLLVAMATDYWQHRGYDVLELRRSLDRARVETAAAAAAAAAAGSLDRQRPWEGGGSGRSRAQVANRTELTGPSDTDSYALLSYRHAGFVGYPELLRQLRRGETVDGKRMVKEQRLQVRVTATILESPALLLRVRVAASAAGTAAADSSNGSETVNWKPAIDLAYLYSEYGSLLRDCKQLESLSIDRLPLPHGNKVQCEWFLFGRPQGHFITEHLPEIQILEIFAAAFALASLTCTAGSLLCGVRGNLRRDSPALTKASALALAAATSCTLTIALFHAKLNLRARRQVFADLPPDVELLSWLRPVEAVSYGWSFYLAWLCVLLSMAESGMWLHQMDRRERDAEWERTRDLVERIRGYYRSRNYVRGVLED